MRNRFLSLILIMALVMSFGYVPVGAKVEVSISTNIEVSQKVSITINEKQLNFYSEVSELISDNWEDDYFDCLNYSEEDGAAFINGEWYLPVKSFCSDAGISFKKNGKKFTISSDEFSWECKINKSSSTLDGESYVFGNKPIKKNGKYMISAEEFDNNSCFEFEESESGVTVKRPYQLKRLIVETNGKKISPTTYGAKDFVRLGNTYVMQFDTEKDAKAAYEKLTSAKKISYVEPDRFIKMIEPDEVKNYSDTTGKWDEFGTQDWDWWDDDPFDWYGGDDGASDWNVSMLGADILAEKIKNAGIDRSVTVAIVDTGIDYNHEYLSSSVISKGYDFINNDNDAMDDNEHGTHVAGIVVSVASGANVSLLPVKVLSGQGSGTSLSVGNGIAYAAEMGADVINLSLGGDSYGTGHYEDKAIQKAISLGSVVVVAAGNEYGDTAYHCPAHMSEPIVVAAIDSAKNRASFSNYGYSVDVSAPGVDILSSVPDGGYEYMSGTSMATPHISGLAALIRLTGPSMSCAEVESKLKALAIDLGTTGYDVYYGYGMPYVGDMEVTSENPGFVTDTPTPTEKPVTPTVKPTSVPTSRPTSVPTATPTLAPTITPVVPPITMPVKPTPTVVPTTKPTAVPTAKPTAVPTLSPSPTSQPIITMPIDYWNTSCSISTSSSFSNGVGSTKIVISAASGVAKVCITVSDGSRYEYINEGTGINKTVTFTKSGLTIEINAYDYNGNIVQNSKVVT